MMVALADGLEDGVEDAGVEEAGAVDRGTLTEGTVEVDRDVEVELEVLRMEVELDVV